MLLELERQEGVATATQPASPAWEARAPKAARNARCSTCSMRSACIPNGLTAEELARFDSIVSATRLLKRGDALYRANDEFQSVYIVRAGSFKTVVMHRDGREQVTGFHLAGEVLGLDGVHSERHSSDAIAIEDSSVCIIPYALLEALCVE